MRKFYLNLFIGIVAFFTYSSVCFALSISVNPFEGGSTLRFTHRSDGIEEIEEVRINISGATGSQYQIYQRLDNFLTNDRGETLDRSAIEASSLQGSNSFGTLYLQGIEKLGFSDQLVYTSNSSGAADSLTVTYRLDPTRINRSGRFLGRIIYTLRPFGAGSQDETDLNLIIETKGDLQVESESSRGQDLVLLDTQDIENQESLLRLLFSDNFDGELKVFQELIRVPTNEKQEELDISVLQFFTSNAENGDLEVRNAVSIDQNKELLYTSENSSDSFDVNFQFNQEVLHQQAAGRYLGKLRYTFETDDRSQTLDIDLDLTIHPIFELVLEYPEEGIDFNNLMPNMPIQTREVKVKVNSNLGKAYQVTQDVSGGLSNQKGDLIEEDFFVFQTEVSEESTGKADQDQVISVKEGSTPIFYSDDEGSSSEFKVIYQIRPYRAMRPGDYALPVKYSLSEI